MNKYPNLWKRGLIQAQVRKRAGHRCEQCGMEFVEGTNIAATARRRDGKPYIGGVHHIDGDKRNCCMNNLVYLCQKCHCYVQWRWEPGRSLPKSWFRKAPTWIVSRGLMYEPGEQLVLFEME